MTQTTRQIPIAEGFRLGDEEYGEPEHCVSWTAHTWDCPGCASLLLAIAEESLAHTRDSDPVACPVCGDKSVEIYGSHHPNVDCLIPGKIRLSENEYLND
jgi:coenzyme F420-reducing hydrogenase gamma subunit